MTTDWLLQKATPVPFAGCWIWDGHTESNGYGQERLNGRHSAAHRVSWEIHIGPIPAGLFVLHSCDVRPCVNPAHLFLGTKAMNTSDMMTKGRDGGVSRTNRAKTTCKEGHAFTRVEGRRRCIQCQRAAYLRWMADPCNREARMKYLAAWKRRARQRRSA